MGVPKVHQLCPHDGDTGAQPKTAENTRVCARLSGGFAPDPNAFPHPGQRTSLTSLPGLRLRPGLHRPSFGLRYRLAKPLGSGANGLATLRPAPNGLVSGANPAPTTARRNNLQRVQNT